jgi:hypothetical protein
MSPNRENNNFKIFFSYSYKSSIELGMIFRKACEDVGATPLFANEQIKIGEEVYPSIRKLIIESDLIVIDLSAFSFWMNREILFAQFSNKPIIFITNNDEDYKKISKNVMFMGMAQLFIFYRDYIDLSLRLKQYLLEHINKYKKKENFEDKKHEENLIDTIKNSMRKNVLILGKDSDVIGKNKIEKIKKVVTNKNYNPVIIRELPEIKTISFESKMVRVAGLCRFILVEDSRPSGHIDEVNICATLQFITATIKEMGTHSTWMQTHYPFEYRFMNRFCYNNQTIPSIIDSTCLKKYSTIEEATENAIKWAENYLKQRERNYKSTLYK